MRAREYPLLLSCLDAGVRRGWRRAHKHGDPTEEAVIDAVVDAVLNEILEAFELEDWEAEA